MAYLKYNLATAKYTKDACSHFSQVRLQLVFSFRGGKVILQSKGVSKDEWSAPLPPLRSPLPPLPLPPMAL